MYGIVLGFTDYVNNISGPIGRCYVADSVPNLISMVNKLRDEYMSKGYKVQRNMQAEEIVDEGYVLFYKGKRDEKGWLHYKDVIELLIVWDVKMNEI